VPDVLPNITDCMVARRAAARITSERATYPLVARLTRGLRRHVRVQGVRRGSADPSVAGGPLRLEVGSGDEPGD
jgi:hypothetical protein